MAVTEVQHGTSEFEVVRQRITQFPDPQRGLTLAVLDKKELESVSPGSRKSMALGGRRVVARAHADALDEFEGRLVHGRKQQMADSLIGL